MCGNPHTIYKVYHIPPGPFPPENRQNENTGIAGGFKTAKLHPQEKNSMEKNRQFVIDGLLVIPAEDMKLCEVDTVKDLETVTVYATAKRNFYQITEGAGLDVKRITEEEARAIIRDHPAGVDVRI